MRAPGVRAEQRIQFGACGVALLFQFNCVIRQAREHDLCPQHIRLRNFADRVLRHRGG